MGMYSHHVHVMVAEVVNTLHTTFHKAYIDSAPDREHLCKTMIGYLETLFANKFLADSTEFNISAFYETCNRQEVQYDT